MIIVDRIMLAVAFGLDLFHIEGPPARGAKRRAPGDLHFLPDFDGFCCFAGDSGAEWRPESPRAAFP